MSTQKALALVRAYGREAVSFQSLTSDCRYWFAHDACVAYVESGGAWVAIGSPLSSVGRESEVATGFTSAAQRAGKRALFFGTERAWSGGASFRLMPLGEQPIWHPCEWPHALSPKLHRQIRQHRARGAVTVREVERRELEHATSPVRRGIDHVMQRWLASRKMAPMGFLVRLNLYEQASERRYFIAEHDGKTVAVMIAMPVYAQRGWLLETCMRCPTAPSGAMELVFDFAMHSFAAEQSAYVSYGLCPLTGTSSLFHRVVRRSSRALYDFDGLRQFKSKLKPTRWQPVYLTYPCTELPARALLDVVGAFCPLGILTFGSQTLWKRARALAVSAPGMRRSKTNVNISSSYGTSATPGAASSSNSSVKTLEAQVSTLTKQIDATNRDAKLDCQTKDARLGTLRAQLERTQGQLQEERAKAREASDSRAAHGTPESDRDALRAEVARQRGGIDIRV